MIHRAEKMFSQIVLGTKQPERKVYKQLQKEISAKYVPRLFLSSVVSQKIFTVATLQQCVFALSCIQILFTRDSKKNLAASLHYYHLLCSHLFSFVISYGFLVLGYFPFSFPAWGNVNFKELRIHVRGSAKRRSRLQV